MSNKKIHLLKVAVVLVFAAAALLIVFLSPAIPVETAASSGGAPTGRTGALGIDLRYKLPQSSDANRAVQHRRPGELCAGADLRY